MNNLINFGNMTDVEMQIIQEQLTAARMESLSGRLAKVEEKIELTKNENENLREMEIARHRTVESRYGFVSASDLGQKFEVSIGSVTMGKLLRLAGIAKSKQSRTEPMRSAIDDGFAKSQMVGEHKSYQWNPEKCIKKIDRWLNKEGIIDEFYKIDDEDKLKEYINELERING